MASFFSRIYRFFFSNRAATAVEYAVMLGIIITASATIAVLGTSTKDTYQNVSDSMEGTGGSGGGSGEGGGGSGGGGGGFCS